MLVAFCAKHLKAIVSCGKRDNNSVLVSSPVASIAVASGSNALIVFALALRVCTVMAIAPACAVTALIAVDFLAVGFVVFAVVMIEALYKVL